MSADQAAWWDGRKAGQMENDVRDLQSDMGWVKAQIERLGGKTLVIASVALAISTIALLLNMFALALVAILMSRIGA